MRQQKHLVEVRSPRRPLVTRTELAAELGLSPYTICHWPPGVGPEPIKVGTRSFRYERADIDAWIASQKRGRPLNHHATS
jgi:predicted DNA-binding transcriptional regulator AlpA